jgi:1,4-dihydroxy-6-naphthoate synthase
VTARIQLGISTCPNDTFAFHGLLSGDVATPGLEFQIELHDVEVLNEALLAGRFDVAKGSFAAAFELGQERVLLPVGAALGYGNGPLVLAPDTDREPGQARTVLGPGRHTTAELLFRLFHPEEHEVQSMIFSQIMGELEAGRADLGICIHEGRFTYAERGLRLVEDLGLRWEAETSCPLPLGGLFAKRALGSTNLSAVQGAIEASLDYAREHPQRALVSMRKYAQEQSDAVLESHVELYVNDSTRHLDEIAEQAVQRLESEARRMGRIGADSPRLDVYRA